MQRIKHCNARNSSRKARATNSQERAAESLEAPEAEEHHSLVIFDHLDLGLFKNKGEVKWKY